MNTVVLRPAKPDDAAILARIHHQVWVECYAHLAPPRAVATLTEGHRLKAWQRLLAGQDPLCRLAVVDQHPIGFVCFGTPSDLVFGASGEVRHLYLLPGLRGLGAGRQLLTSALQSLSQDGFSSAALAVVEENRAARAFYAAAGGTEEGAFTNKGPLWRSRNILVRWRFRS